MPALYCQECAKTKPVLKYYPGEATLVTSGTVRMGGTGFLCDGCPSPIKGGEQAVLVEYFMSEEHQMTGYWKPYFDGKKGVSGRVTSKTGVKVVENGEYHVKAPRRKAEHFAICLLPSGCKCGIGWN